MVATLVRLRFRILGNNLKRSTWQLVATILGGLYALGMLGGLLLALIVAGQAGDPRWIGVAVVLGGSLLTLGWVVGPLLIGGVDQTLEPARLAQFPIPLRTLLVGITVAGMLGIPALVSLVAGLGTVAAWIRVPAAAIAAVPCAVLGVLIAVVASRTVAALSASLQSSRRYRELSSVIILFAVILIYPAIIFFTQGSGTFVDTLPGLANGLGWTPLGASWAVPAAIAGGDWVGAALRLLIALATVVLLFVLWRRALATALVTPPSAEIKRVARGKIGAFAWVPQTPAGAVMARSLTYWRRDPRYGQQLISAPLMLVILWFYSTINDGAPFLMWGGPIVGFFLAMVLVTDISYDGTAFATHLIDGVRGRDDRLGRVAAAAVIAVPLTLIATLIGVGLTGEWTRLPAMLGLAFGALATGYGAASVSSARFVMPVKQAGDNPFKSTPGAGFTQGLQTFAVWGIVLLVLSPAIVLTVLDLVIGPLFGWIALIVALVIGVVALIIGIRVGGRLLDRTGPTLLAQLKRMRNA
ncbi:transporter [Cnuibacter physcomitrellae]|uniref:transporter n=1 Tax=Cnuibacter physcomitrellae TaxID=1619308 RepID=UPI0021758B6D|nr:transporter [Cnuibacter physcomitrellae]MCS5496337.1 transporter [Cnuibacter physcomitrellae]